jgi:hypothetical protein
LPYDPGYLQGSFRDDVAEARLTLVLASLAGLAAIALALDLAFADTVNSWGRPAGTRSGGATSFTLAAALGVALSLLVLALGVFGAVYAIGVARTTSHRVRSLALVAATVCAISLLVLVAVSALSL